MRYSYSAQGHDNMGTMWYVKTLKQEKTHQKALRQDVAKYWHEAFQLQWQ